MAPPAGPSGLNGVLPISALHKNGPGPAGLSTRGPKAAQPRLKLICRRLPPGLTRLEFDSVLGDQWRVGAGKVDCVSYKKGSVSTDAAKPSKPARAYLHVTKHDHVKLLGDHIRSATFHDAAKSWQDPALVGPPTLEYAPYPKMPGGRKRNDNRQGTIDQDHEFKDFLQSLTNPITKPAAPENEPPKDKVKTTPLIEALREKKANRDKPNTKTNRQTRGDAKEDAADRFDKKILAKPGKENALNAGDKNRRISKADKAQAAKDAVKILNKEASASKTAAAAATAPTDKAAPAGPTPERKRGNIALAKSMLQRDLGIGPTPNRRRGTKREVGPATSNSGAHQTKDAAAQDEKAKEVTPAQTSLEKPAHAHKKERPTRAERRAFKAGQGDKSTAKGTTDDSKTHTSIKNSAPQILKKPQPVQAPITPKGPAASRAPPTEPAATRNSAPPTKPENNPPDSEPTLVAPSNIAPKPAPASPAPSSTSKQAFLKHANPSQGITELLIEEALKVFGDVEKVEIDKRKGFAYVDFAEPEGLQKAMAASPIKIAQGAVQVLERKEKFPRNPRFNGPPTGPARGGRGGFPHRGRGGRGGGRGGGHAASAVIIGAGGSTPASPATAQAVLAPAASSDAAT